MTPFYALIVEQISEVCDESIWYVNTSCHWKQFDIGQSNISYTKAVGGGGGILCFNRKVYVKEKCFNLTIILVKYESCH